jgi:hypothetical protein
MINEEFIHPELQQVYHMLRFLRLLIRQILFLLLCFTISLLLTRCLINNKKFDLIPY